MLIKAGDNNSRIKLDSDKQTRYIKQELINIRSLQLKQVCKSDHAVHH